MTQEKMMKVLIAALAAFVVTSPALAAESDNPLARDKAVLTIKDLDLASVDGQRRLAIRMDEAARAVCGYRVATIHLALNEQSRACQADVVASIRSRIETRSAAATSAVLAAR